MLRWGSLQLPLLFYGILITRPLLNVVFESGIDPFILSVARLETAMRCTKHVLQFEREKPAGKQSRDYVK